MDNWTQPICRGCYREREPERRPVRIKPEFREREICCLCSKATREGIYYRIDPRLVPYPKPEEED